MSDRYMQLWRQWLEVSWRTDEELRELAASTFAAYRLREVGKERASILGKLWAVIAEEIR
ncbi:hypothetical protein [Synechococcus sp. RS9916]|uniref:hypothetical protein n=1 Tax=Synechococcus sp. RS9916 TaxID=221359 RepID=UPI0000E5393B|nr:hypothetical protein [Synechococcus sp. RS9916]EAU74233.1 hypothetical protein RS9916_32037 [Synechococcus sp. RS9916]